MVSLYQDTHANGRVGINPAPRLYTSMTLRCPTLLKRVCLGVSTQERALHKQVCKCPLTERAPALDHHMVGRLANWNTVALLAESPTCTSVQHVVAYVWCCVCGGYEVTQDKTERDC
jgi:hypothetical protein